MSGTKRPSSLINACSSEYAVCPCRGRRWHSLQTEQDALRRPSPPPAHPIPFHARAVSGAAAIGGTAVDGSGHFPGTGACAGAVAEGWRPPAGEQGWPVRAAPPECASALPEGRRQRGDGHPTAERRRELAETGYLQTQSPHHPEGYQTVVCKDQALTVLPSGEVRLPTGGQRPPLLLPLPAEYHAATRRRAALTWRAEHDELCLTLDTGASRSSPLPAGEVAGVDLGEVHIAAVTTTTRHALVVSGRQLRACKPWRNQVHSVLQEQLRRCQARSRRSRRLTARKARLSAKRYRQISCTRRRGRSSPSA